MFHSRFKSTGRFQSFNLNKVKFFNFEKLSWPSVRVLIDYDCKQRSAIRARIHVVSLFDRICIDLMWGRISYWSYPYFSIYPYLVLVVSRPKSYMAHGNVVPQFYTEYVSYKVVSPIQSQLVQSRISYHTTCSISYASCHISYIITET